MKLLLVLAMAVITIACSTPGKTTDTKASTESRTKTKDSLFKSAITMGCNIKYPNSKEMCNCHGEVIYQATPAEVRASFTTDPSAKFKLLSIMLDNSDKLKTCGKPTEAETEADSNTDEPAVTSCYDDGAKPAYYLNDRQSNLTLSAEQTALIEEIDPSVSQQDLIDHFYSDSTQKLTEANELLASRFEEEGKSTAQINQAFADSIDKTIQCSDSSVRKFYSDEETNALYRLNYAGYDNDVATEVIFQQAKSRWDTEGKSDDQQKNELRKFVACEIKLCIQK